MKKRVLFLLAVLLIVTALVSCQQKTNMLSPGLYDENDNLVASWDELVDIYSMNVTQDYMIESYSTNTSSPCYVLSNNDKLSSGVKLVIGKVSKIGDFAFTECANLATIIIPDSVTSIGEGAFYNCSLLTSVSIPDSVRIIEFGAFAYCVSLESIIVDENNKVYHTSGNCLIETASKKLVWGGGTSVIPSDGSVTSIDIGAFAGSRSLTSITIPDSVKSIGYSAFEDCISLASATIGNGVTSIGYETFGNCALLKSITIGNDVTNMEYCAFKGCSSLETITFNGTKEEWNAIEKEHDWDVWTGDYIVHCTDGDIEK